MRLNRKTETEIPTNNDQGNDSWINRPRKNDADLQEESWMSDEYYDQWDDEDERR